MKKVIPFPSIRKNDSSRFSNILAEAEREHAESKAGAVAYTFLIAFILGTLVPYKPISIFASMAVMPLCVIYFAVCYKHPFLFIRKSFAALAALVALTVASGCSSGYIFNADQSVLDLCRNQFGESCRFGVSTGISIFGIQIKEASIEAAIKKGGLKKTYAIDRTWSGGIVSTSKIIVYGG